jgi:hypothetical protein
MEELATCVGLVLIRKFIHLGMENGAIQDMR